MRKIAPPDRYNGGVANWNPRAHTQLGGSYARYAGRSHRSAPVAVRHEKVRFQPQDSAFGLGLPGAVIDSAPSSYGLQPWKFVVVTDQAVRQKLHAPPGTRRRSWTPRTLWCSARKIHPLRPTSKNTSPASPPSANNPRSALDGYKQMMLGSLSRMTPAERDEWAARQCYIALGVFLATAAAVGVDACPMEGSSPKNSTRH